MKRDGGNPERLNVTLSTELLAKLEAEAVAQDRTTSWLARTAIREYFERRDVGKTEKVM